MRHGNNCDLRPTLGRGTAVLTLPPLHAEILPRDHHVKPLKYRCSVHPRGARGDVRISCRIKAGQHLCCGVVASSGCFLEPRSSSRKIFRNTVAAVIDYAKIPLCNRKTLASRFSKPRRCFREIAYHSFTVKIEST